MRTTFLVIINSIVLAIIASTFFCSCANIIPPTGGPRDTLAPIQMAALPKDSTINFTAKKITLTFNEYIEVKDIQQNVVVNPLPKNQPLVEYKLQNVFITLKDSLEPNTTYNINFGNAIKDINEGNIAHNKQYIFSTGKTIDQHYITGKVINAEDGKIDSTLLAVLYANTSDTAVYKLKPKYIAKLDGKGFFRFNNLPAATFNLFVLPNDYSKKYDDSTKTFAFLNNTISTTDSINNFILYAYKQFEVAEKTNNNQNEAKANANQPLKYTTNITNKKFDVLDTPLTINFSKKVLVKNINLIELTDTNYVKLTNYKIDFDSIKNDVNIRYNFLPQTNYKLIINKEAITDTLHKTISNTDTLRFTTLSQEDYGSIKIKALTANTNHAVLQIINNGKIIKSLPFIKSAVEQKLFKPGEYDLRILLDENDNLTWDAGNYKQKKQPEKVIALTKKLNVKANWDNEIEISW